MKDLYVADVVQDSIVDGPGIRFVIFTQGCNHHCKNCHNQSTWAIESKDAKYISIDELLKMIENNPLLSGVTISGGEPLLQPEAVCEFIRSLKNKHSQLNIILYTAYKVEVSDKIYISEFRDNSEIDYILNNVNYIVDGEYIDSLRDISLRFRGSKNQRIINVKEVRVCEEFPKLL